MLRMNARRNRFASALRGVEFSDDYVIQAPMVLNQWAEVEEASLNLRVRSLNLKYNNHQLGDK